MTKKTWIIFAVVCTMLLGGLIWLSKSKQVNVDSVDIHAIQTANDQNGNIGDRIFGNKDAKVVIIEYGDFQCPGCGDAAPVLRAVSEKYKDDVAFIFRNFPLTSIHPNAMTAAAAAEAAGLQGKYWEMHHNLYELQNDWSSLSGQNRLDTFVGYAEGLGLNKEQFLKDIDSKNVAAKIKFDRALGTKAGVTGTPSIFVNGKKADQSVRDGKLVAANNNDPLVWSTQELFEKHILVPALKEAGVSVKE